MILYGAAIVKLRGTEKVIYLSRKLRIAPQTKLIVSLWPESEEPTINNTFRLCMIARAVNSSGTVGLNLSRIPCRTGDRIAFRVEDLSKDKIFFPKESERPIAYQLAKHRRAPKELLEDDT